MNENADMNRTNFILDYQKVMKHLENENFVLQDQSVDEREVCIKIPKRFSISEQPDETINLLRKLYTLGKCENVSKMRFDHSECEFLGLSASTIMDIILLVVIKYRKETKTKLTLSGKFPHNQMVKDIFLASGLPYHLNISLKLNYDKNHIERFETISGECSEDKDKRQSGKVATELTEYFNRCLRHQNMKLRQEGTLLLATLLGEVIGNCEIHGGRQATWYTQGHYEDNFNKVYGEMQLLFLNLGKTIYKGLKYDSSEETKERLNFFLEKHNPFFSETWSEEMACTVFALQEGISRLRDRGIKGYETRGTGTVSLIETLNLIGKCQDGPMPEMTIVSGQTYIKFNGQYIMNTETFKDDLAFGSGKKKIIAFNKENNIYKPADKTVVQQLRENFPGTVISLKFYLDSRYIMDE